MMLPNFLIVGAPKCGTTSVADWLSLHPDAFMVEGQEPFYLVDRELGEARSPAPYFGTHGLAGYAALFSAASAAKVRFEATTHYLYQDCALRELSAFPEPPKILIMLRQPSRRLHSSFKFEQNHLANVDPEYTFPAYVEDVLAGDEARIRRACRNEGTYLTLRDGLRHGEYARYVERWTAAFGGGVRLWFLECMARNEHRYMAELGQWLELDPSPFSEMSLKASNVGYRVRWPRFHRLARDVARRVKLPGPLRAAYWRVIKGSAPVAESIEERAALDRLDRHYRPHDQRLAHWASFAPELPPWCYPT